VLSIAKIKENEAEIMDVLRKFAKDMECFTNKIAGAAMIPICYASVSAASQQELLMYFIYAW